MRQFLGLGVLSGAALLLEIALTRLLSTLYFPPYVFGVLSVAVLGIGLGAALGAWRADLRRTDNLALYSMGAAAGTLIAVVFIVTVQAPVIHQLLFVFVSVPYVFVGLAISTLFSKAPQASATLYTADLLGAGVGAVLAIPVLNALGALNAALAAVFAFALCAVIFTANPRTLTAAAVGAAVIASNAAFGWLAVDFSGSSANKPITAALARGGEILDTRWDAFARTDLVAPGDGGPYQLFVDGAAGSVMPPADNNTFLLNDIGFFPFATSQPGRVMVIGPGGGLDVWLGLQANARTIYGVEVNPGSVVLVNDYANYNGGLLGAPGVTVVVDEGRSALRRDETQYDLIFLSQVITETAERTGYALSENTVYTVEAFGDYLAHLTPNGQIALKLYDEPTLTRALSSALAAFRAEGMTDAQAIQHTAAFIDPTVQPPLPLLLVKRTVFNPQEAMALGAVAREVGFAPLYLPGVIAQPPLDAVEAGATTFSEIVADSETNITPPTDNRPYFFQFERGIPRSLQPIGVLAGVLALGLLALWGVFGRALKPAPLRWLPFYFACLGVGFIAIEIAAIQMTGLFLGHPTLAVTVVLAAFLIGGGVGSRFASAELDVSPLRVPPLPALGVAVMAVLWVFVWNTFSDNLLAAAAPVRVGFAVLSLLPLTLLMGVPFPTGLRALAGSGEGHIAAAWAVNGVTTVIGSVGAVILSVLFGFNTVLITGIAAYILAVVIAQFGSAYAEN